MSHTSICSAKASYGSHFGPARSSSRQAAGVGPRYRFV